MSIISIIQSIVAILLITAVMLQQKGTALGSAFGGGDGGGGSYSTKRGLEKKLYWATVVLGVIFVVLSVLNLTI
ncbi:preprotein translocase subunit SecG [Patescibacteria group bacterium]|nr:preprotein translocase subunit SecG [Patescibacteria group bacterium]